MSAPLGFVGLGAMGGPMAANLAGAGNALIVHDAAGTQARQSDKGKQKEGKDAHSGLPVSDSSPAP